MSKHRKQSISVFIASLSVVALSAISLTTSVPEVANASTDATCPTGWTYSYSSASALDGIYCDKAVDANVSFEVPVGISEIMYLTIGGGGGGADGHTSGGQVYAGGGGGAGELSSGHIPVTPGDTFALTFSVGGAAVNGDNGQDGSDVKYTINSGADTVLSKGGGGGLKSGSGGAAGGVSGLAGGAGSNTPDAIAAGGGGGWAFAGDPGITSPEAKAGWGGEGVYSDIDTEIDAILPIDSHWSPFYPGGREALDYTFLIPSGQAPSFYDQMGIGGPGGVVVESTGGEDSNETCERAVGHYLDGDIMVSEKGMGTCYEKTNLYYATGTVTPVHPGFGGVGGVGTQDGSNGQTGLAYLRIYVPNIYLNTIDSDKISIGKTDVVNFTYDAPDRSGIGYFVDGNYVGGIAGYYNSALTGADIWDEYGTAIGGECREIVFEARLYSLSIVATTFNEVTFSWSLYQVATEGDFPDSNTDYLDSAQVIVTADACSTGGGSHSGGSSNSSLTSKPDTPTKPRINVTSGPSLLNVAIGYSGLSSNRPSSYNVTVYPGGNSCVAYGEISSCEISGLKVGVFYKVSIVAVNAFGSSGKYVSAQNYFLTKAGLATFTAKRTIDSFPGDSPKLLNSLKIKIKKFLAKYPEVRNFTCTGYTAGPVKKSDKFLAKKRAFNVCAYIEKIKPSISTTTIGKTPGLAWGPANRKVVIRGYSVKTK